MKIYIYIKIYIGIYSEGLMIPLGE